jgi:hypothetical protein
VKGDEPEVVGVGPAGDRLEVLEGFAHPGEVDLDRALAVDARELLVGFEEVGLVG